jgi:two-component system, OmpR family, phosphate regulon response regulator PhoB
MTESRRTVLICEDEPMLRELIRVSLDSSYRFREAATVGEAEAALGSGAPDVVLIDLMLPGGSGIDVLRALRRIVSDRHVPAIVISAWSTDAYRSAAAEAGADAFVSKPFVPEELAALVARLIEE